LLVVVVLLGAFALIAAQLFALTLKTSGQATRGQAEIHRFDDLIEQLRRDMWNANSLTLADPTHLQITQTPDCVIAWTFESGRVRRLRWENIQEQSASVQRTFDGIPALHFISVGPILRVVVADTTLGESAKVASPGSGGGGGQVKTQEITLVSQILLAERGRAHP
jgi:hypothetical protein